MNHIKSIIFLLIVGSSLQVSAQDTLRLDLETCRNLALENNNDVKIADANIAKAESEKKVAKSAYYPKISASVTGAYTKNQLQSELYLPTQVFDPTTGQLVPNVAINPVTGEPIIGPDGNPVFNTYGYLPLDMTLYGGALANVSAQQPIYTGGKIKTGNKMAAIGYEMATQNKVLKKTAAKYEADQMYYLYLSTREKVKLAHQYKELLAGLVKLVDDSYQTGMTNKNELLKVQVQYNDALLQTQKAESGLNLARMSLCRVIGVDFDTPLEIEEGIDEVNFDPASLSAANASNREEYRLLKNQITMAERQVDMVKADYLPTAGVSLGYNYGGVILKDTDNYDFNGFNAMVNVKIPIVTFGEKAGKLSSAKASLDIKKLELQKAEQLLQLEIEQARLNLIDAYTRIELTEEALGQADENLRVSQDNYNLGMETIINLLEAQAEWQKAYSNKIDALTDFKVKESNFLRVANKL